MNNFSDIEALPVETFEQVLEKWQAAKDLANKASKMERELRLALFSGAVPTPKEGVNNVELANGRICKFTYKINRTVAQEQVPAVLEQLRQLGHNDTDKFLKPKYELVKRGYDADPAARRVLDEAITSRPGLPTLEVR